jgi:hypothetical protein
MGRGGCLSRRVARCAVIVLLVISAISTASLGAASPGVVLVKSDEVKEWLTYIASDELQGRATYSEGLGLAASYIEDHLREWGVKPGGDHGTYLQEVSVLGVKATSRSTVTVRVGRESRTFKDGDGLTFPKYSGGKRMFTLDHVEFAGYGLDAPAINHMDFQDKNVKGAAVVYLGQNGPRGFDADANRSLLTYRDRYVTDGLHAAALIGPQAASFPPGPVPGGRGRGAASATGAAVRLVPDFTTSRRLDLPRAPAITAGDDFYAFLFSRAPVRYDDLKRRADAQDPLPSFALDGVSITFNVDVDYEVLRTQLTHNVVGIVDGADPQLRATYVAFGAHYDHLGYADGPITPNGPMSPPFGGRVNPSAPGDRIWNGADDDGSGTVAEMALAHAFATGPRPKRSLLFVWHAGEELGTYGSLYYADHPTVPLDHVVAQLNIDMIGRNRNDDPNEKNTVYLVGSDRISSELDQISRDADRDLAAPLKIDYEMNDLSDPEQIYYRSDHYSYAEKGIPVIFFTTGLHPDYHANTDEVSKILFDKLTKVAQLVYETGTRVANLDHAPVRDNKGARAGKGTRQ